MLVVSPYNIPIDRNADSSEYDVFTSEDMKDMAKILENMMKLVAHGHVVSS